MRAYVHVRKDVMHMCAYMQNRGKEAKNLAERREYLGKVGGQKGKGVNDVIILQFFKSYERAMCFSLLWCQPHFHFV